MTLDSLGPLPPIEKRSFHVGDVVVYDGFVFAVSSTDDESVDLVSADGQLYTIPSTAISLL
jgi:small-conductance mechanosensitive channel